MTWWGWMTLGTFLFGAELFAIDARLCLVFLGLSAILVRVLDFFGVPMSEAMRPRVAEQNIAEFGNLAKVGNTLVVPANLADICSMLALTTNIVRSKPSGST
jgi:hypothetical protein